MVYGLIEGRIRRDCDARVALEARSREDVDLYSGAVKSGVAGGGRAVEYKYWQIGQIRVGGII